jgi:hypothetical protein
VDGFAEYGSRQRELLRRETRRRAQRSQRLRERTINGLEAIAALGPHASGRVIWNPDWERFDATDGRTSKLSVIDTGSE